MKKCAKLGRNMIMRTTHMTKTKQMKKNEHIVWLWYIEIVVIILEHPVISQTSINLNYGPIKIESRVSKPLCDARIWGDLSIVNQSFSHGNLFFVVACSRKENMASLHLFNIGWHNITELSRHSVLTDHGRTLLIDINVFHHVVIDTILQIFLNVECL